MKLFELNSWRILGVRDFFQQLARNVTPGQHNLKPELTNHLATRVLDDSSRSKVMFPNRGVD
jgi:hypothetical protein